MGIHDLGYVVPMDVFGVFCFLFKRQKGANMQCSTQTDHAAKEISENLRVGAVARFLNSPAFEALQVPVVGVNMSKNKSTQASDVEENIRSSGEGKS